MSKSKGIDLSKFKHVSSDKNSTRLKHQDGHFLVIAHKGVSGDLKAHLDALSQNSSTVKSPNADHLSNIAKDAMDIQDKHGYADGGYLKKLPEIKESDVSHKAKQLEREKASRKPFPRTKEFAEGGYTGTPADNNSSDFDPNKSKPPTELKPEPYAKPSTTKASDGATSPQDTRSVGDKVRDAGHAVKAATGATYGNYAEGGDVSQVVPDYTHPPVKVDPLPVEQQGLPSDVQQTREIYNRLASNINPHGMTKPITSLQFGPNGEEPKEFNPKLAQQAQLEHSEEKADSAANIAGQQQSTIADNQARTAMGLQPLPVPNTPDGQQIPGSPTGNQPQDPSNINSLLPKPQDPMAAGMDAQTGLMQKGYQNQLSGINKGAEAQGKLGEEQANLLNENIKSQTDAQAAYQKHYNDLETERQAHMTDIQNNQIDPTQYWNGDKNGNGSHSKIASAIGMILAGFGGVAGSNSASQFLQYQMDQNINAQKQNLDSKQNLLAANLRQFGNLRDATDMTRLMQSDIIGNELKVAAAKAQSPLAKAAALQAAGQLQMQYAPLQQQMAMRQAMMNLANNGGSPGSVEHMLSYMRMTNPEQAKEMEARYVPGVGLASVPVPAAVRDQLVSHQKLDSIGNDVLKFAQTHTNLVPGTASYNEGVQKSMILQQAIREGLLGTVFRESEKPLLQKFVDDNPAGAFKTISTEPKIKTILDSNRMQMNILKKSNGLPTQQATQAPDQPQYKTVNGVKYMRGPDGKAIPVK